MYQTSNLKSVCKSPRDLSSEASDMAPVTCLAIWKICFLLCFVKVSASICIFLASMLIVDVLLWHDIQADMVNNSVIIACYAVCLCLLAFVRVWQWVILSIFQSHCLNHTAD